MRPEIYYTTNTMSSETILIADDDSDYLFQQAFYLARAGYKVLQAGSEKEALALLEKGKPDLAIFDLMMENEDSGFRLSYKLKKKYPDVPVILATAVTAETGITFGMNSREDQNWIKADLYLEKGMQPEKLLAEVKNLLQK